MYRSGPARHSGFTLVEILVVLVIVSIVISFAVLKIGVTGRDSGIEDEQRRIQGLMGLLQERAVLEGRDFGLLIEPNSYQFVVYQTRRQRWENFNEEREYRRRDLPQGLSFELQMDSRQIILKPRNQSIKGDEPQVAPQLIIAASGEGTPFKLTLVRAGTDHRGAINADAFGKVTLESPNTEKPRT